MAREIAVGIVGTSWWTELMYLPSLASHPQARVAAICGRRRAPAEALAASWGIPAVYDDARALLDHDGLDAVMVVTPDDTHAAITLAAIERGLNVLCEKALANSAGEALAMYRAAEARGVRHMVLFTWRFLPQLRLLRQLVEAGRIGTCRQMTAYFIGDFARQPTYQWCFDGHRANGVLGGLGSHLVDLFRLFVGEIESVCADLQTIVDRTRFDGPVAALVNDAGFVLLRGAGGAQGALHLTAVSPSGDRDMRLGLALHGDAGVLEAELVFDGAEKGFMLRGLGPGETRFATLEVPGDLLAGAAPDDPFGPFTRASAGPRFFIDAILGDLPIPMSFEAGWRAQAVVDAALRSDRERRWVAVEGGALSPP
jgi:predicted dehydrogenase